MGSTTLHSKSNRVHFNSALGLDTLARQKEHHYTFICGRSAHPQDEELAKKFRHGTENEVNVVSTLVGYIMPAFLHNCYAFFEVGPKILNLHGMIGVLLLAQMAYWNVLMARSVRITKNMETE